MAKGLWRDELPYVMDMMDFNIRPMLKRLLEWKIGCEHDFSLSIGKSAKYMKNYLSAEEYQQFLATYSRAQKEDIWDAVFGMCQLFQTVAIEVCKKLNFDYDYKEAGNSKDYLEHIRILPADAEKIY